MKNQRFYNCVISKDTPPEGFVAAGSLSPEEGFAVYQRAYIARLTEALGDTYESVWKVLGDSIFFDVCEKFIVAHGSQAYNLSDYSVKFIDYLISQSASVEFPFLSDLAHLNWLHKEVFHRPQETGLSGNALMALLEKDQGRAMTIEAFELFKSEYCVFDIWKALKENTTPPESFLQKQFMVLYKSDHQVYVKQLTERQYKSFESIRMGLPIMDALDSLEEFELTELFHFLSKQALLKNLV
jgi:hypothetical protein